MPNDQKVKAQRVLELNINHPIFEKLKMLYESDKDRLKKYADVLTLKFYYQYSDSEIAGLVQTSPENVRVRLHRGKRKLTALLKGDERFNGSQNRR